MTLRRGKARAEEPLPAALIPGQPIPDWNHRDAVQRFARGVPRRRARRRASSRSSSGGSRARGSTSLCPRPRSRSTAATSSSRARRARARRGRARRRRSRSCARAVASASRRSATRRSRSSSPEIEREAREQGFAFRGRKKSSGEDTRFEGEFVDSSDHWRDLLDEELQLVAGTSWLFAREDFAGFLDTLIVDEAGQVALADVVAVGHAARNLVLLGDPNQLPQVSQGAMPDEAKASVLQHLLGEETTVPPDRGIFLERTWRLRPGADRVHVRGVLRGPARVRGACAHGGASRPGTGSSVRPGRARGERAALARGGGRGRGGDRARCSAPDYTDETGATRPLGVEDVLVVTPYNAQVRTLRQAVPEGVRVGTVDKFQGQEAPVVIVSLASSSGEDAPRGLSFVFNKNRINVATSRAQCRVELVCSPRLLEADCKTRRRDAARERALPLRRARGVRAVVGSVAGSRGLGAAVVTSSVPFHRGVKRSRGRTRRSDRPSDGSRCPPELERRSDTALEPARTVARTGSQPGSPGESSARR